MFTEKSCTVVYSLDREIKVVGVNLQKSGLLISFDSLGELWGVYGEKYRGKVENRAIPQVEYAVCLNKALDYIAGCEVTEIGEMDEGWLSFIIPPGKYIKDTFSAETFELLVTEELGKRNVKGWAKENGVKIDEAFSVEVYPIEAVEGTNVEMYTLTPVKG